MPKKKTVKKVSSMKTKAYPTPDFLVDLLNARSPTGAEYEAQAVVDQYVENEVDTYRRDTMGNRFATVNPEGDPSLLFAGHIDELGLIITYINDQGFVYFDTLGGHDKTMISDECAGPQEGARDPRNMDRSWSEEQGGGRSTRRHW
jgi:hypothetical protein